MAAFRNDVLGARFEIIASDRVTTRASDSVTLLVSARSFSSRSFPITFPSIAVYAFESVADCLQTSHFARASFLLVQRFSGRIGSSHRNTANLDQLCKSLRYPLNCIRRARH